MKKIFIFSWTNSSNALYHILCQKLPILLGFYNYGKEYCRKYYAVGHSICEKSVIREFLAILVFGTPYVLNTTVSTKLELRREA